MEEVSLLRGGIDVTSFLPTDEEREFVNVARVFAMEEIRPVAREIEQKCLVHKSLVKELDEIGFLSLEIPENLGGLELPLISQVQIFQALSYGDLDVVQGLPGLGDAASLVRILKENPIISSINKDLFQSGKTVAYLDLIENENSKVTIKNNGSEWVIEGVSQPVRLATIADYLIVAGKDDKGTYAVLWFDLKNQHVQVDSGDYRLGLLASGIGRFVFDNLRLSSQFLLAEGQGAFHIAASTRNRIRVLQAAKQVGLMEAALDYATEYTASRKAFGQEIAKFQGVSFRIARMAIETRIANHFVWQAALECDEGKKSASGTALRALYRAHHAVRFVTDSAVQLLGGHGYIKEFPVEKWMRDAQAQVTLYGRERDLLIQRGEQILGETIEVTIP